MPIPSNRQRGSVLIYIFIAVALLAALTFAATRSSRESLSTVDRERAELQATQILDYVGMIRRAVQVVSVNGARPQDICFHSARWGHNNYDPIPGAPHECPEPRFTIFAPTGGGASFQDPPRDLFDVAFEGEIGYGRWLFTGANTVAGVGSDGTDPENAELLLVLPYLRRDVCVALNRKLQIPNPDTPPQDNPHFNITTPFAGTFTALQSLNTANLEGRRSGCFAANTTPADGSFVFYTVLIAR